MDSDWIHYSFRRCGSDQILNLNSFDWKSNMTRWRRAATLLLLSILTVSSCGDVVLKTSKVRFLLFLKKAIFFERRQENETISHFDTTTSGSPLATGIHCLFSSLCSTDMFLFLSTNIYICVLPADFNVPVMVKRKCGWGHEEKVDVYVQERCLLSHTGYLWV